MQTKRLVLSAVLLMVGALGLVSPMAVGMITVWDGNSPMHESNWPEGTVDVANLPDRQSCAIGPPFGGGEYHFSFKSADTNAINQALEIFARIKAPQLILILIDPPGPKEYWATPEKKRQSNEAGIPWILHVWDRQCWHSHYNDPLNDLYPRGQRRGDPPPPPELTIGVGEGGVIWEELKIPKNLTILDKRTTGQSPRDRAGLEVHGTVRDMATGKGIAGAEVSGATRDWGEQALPLCQTDETGHFVLKGLPGPVPLLQVKAEGYASRLWNVNNETGRETLETVIELSKSVNQKILVTDLEGNPVPEALIMITRAMGIDGLDYTYRGDLRTNALGEAVAEGLPTGYAIIRCLTNKYQVFPAIIEKIPFKGALTGFQSGPPQQALTFRLTKIRGGSLRGRFTNAKGEPVLASNSVQAMGTADFSGGHADGHATVGPDGAFEIKDLPAGNYSLMGMKPSDGGGYVIPFSSEPTTYQVNENAVTDVGTLVVKE
jgi:hypothetical protein